MAYFTPPAFQRLVNLRLGKGCIGTKHHFLAQFLLPLNLRQQKFFPAIGTMNIAGPQLGRQTVAVSVEEQQRMVAGRLEMLVVGALFLRTVHRNLRRIHVQHGPGPDLGTADAGFELLKEFRVAGGQLEGVAFRIIWRRVSELFGVMPGVQELSGVSKQLLGVPG
jgi:hypothetical protein